MISAAVKESRYRKKCEEFTKVVEFDSWLGVGVAHRWKEWPDVMRNTALKPNKTPTEKLALWCFLYRNHTPVNRCTFFVGWWERMEQALAMGEPWSKGVWDMQQSVYRQWELKAYYPLRSKEVFSLWRFDTLDIETQKVIMGYRTRAEFYWDVDKGHVHDPLDRMGAALPINLGEDSEGMYPPKLKRSEGMHVVSTSDDEDPTFYAGSDGE